MSESLVWLAPGWLWALPLSLLAGAWLRRGHLAVEVLHRPVSVRHPQAGRLPNAGQWHSGWPSALLGAILALLICALAQPVRLGAELPRAASERDLLLIVDTAVSMGLRDYAIDGKPVDRLTMSQLLLDGFVQGFDAQRLGLIVLGHPSAWWLPWTTDKALARAMIRRLQPTLAGRASALGDALALAASGAGAGREQIVVVISDAVYTSGTVSPAEGARMAREAGQTVHSIAIGAIREIDSERQWGGLLYEPTNLATLAEVASIGAGQMFHAVDYAAMQQALQSIESSHQRSVGALPAERLRQPLYAWPLATALLLLAVLPFAVGAGRRGGA